ncbi:MAG: hypothetical protein ABI651_08155 [Verrucomicrobiota bacterium]
MTKKKDAWMKIPSAVAIEEPTILSRGRIRMFWDGSFTMPKVSLKESLDRQAAQALGPLVSPS